MIAEFFIHLMSWDSVWYANPGDFRWNLKHGRFHVGVWTGPQHDLICVRKCDTNKKADEFLSPGGRTILEATVKAIWKRMTTLHMDHDGRRRYEIIFNFFTGHRD